MTAMVHPAYAVEHLTKQYGRAKAAANDDISLVIDQGGFFGIFGPNGAGKTTLVRQMAGLLKPTAGRIFLFGHDVVASPEVVPRYLGYFGQRIAALRYHTFREVIVITGVLRGLGVGAARQQAGALIDRFAGEALASCHLWKLSGGEQRLALLLATFAGASPVLVLDEPTNELDPIRRRAVWDYLAEANQRHGTTVVLVTHNLAEAERAIERVAIIDQGRIQAVGTPGELKRRVADLVRLELRLRDGAATEAEHRLAQLDGSTRLRPGRWEITRTKDRATDLLPQIIDLVGLDALDDFRLITPTMEDVYVHVTGKRWQTAAAEDTAPGGSRDDT